MTTLGDAMLSRVAECLYWAGRQLIRAEDTARAILSQHGLAMNPQGRELADWPALVAALGHPPSSWEKTKPPPPPSAPPSPSSPRTCKTPAQCAPPFPPPAKTCAPPAASSQKKRGDSSPTCATGPKRPPIMSPAARA